MSKRHVGCSVWDLGMDNHDREKGKFGGYSTGHSVVGKGRGKKTSTASGA